MMWVFYANLGLGDLLDLSAPSVVKVISSGELQLRKTLINVS